MSKIYMVDSTHRGVKKNHTLSADLLRTVGLNENYYGVRTFIDNRIIEIDWYPGRDKAYAKSMVEKYITSYGRAPRLL